MQLSPTAPHFLDQNKKGLKNLTILESCTFVQMYYKTTTCIAEKQEVVRYASFTHGKMEGN
jgi:hypothetical protein